MIFFSSDTHFFHKNVIQYCNRPFTDIEHMNKLLVINWNKKISPRDEVYFLGDFSFGNHEQTEDILKQLNGIKYLVRGNHDKKFNDKFLLNFFKWVKDYFLLEINEPDILSKKQSIALFHYPLRTWEKIHYGAWHLFGHSHGSMKLDIGKSLDVGVDCHNYEPISYDEIKIKFKGKQIETLDHHKEN